MMGEVKLDIFCSILFAFTACGTTSLEGQTCREDWVNLSLATDDDCDGVLEGCRRFVYEDGNLISSIYDRDCDGSADICYTRRYHDDGRLLAITVDHGCYGTPSQCSWFIYDPEGRDLETREDLDCDSIIDCISHRYERDETGLLSVRFSDDDCDGVFDHCWYYTRPGDAEVLVISEDEDCDGHLESCTEYLLRDDLGRVTYWTTDDGCDGTPDTCHTNTYLADGTMERRSDDLCDGSFDVCRVHGNGDDGQQIASLISEDEGCDGVLEWCSVCDITYDGSGTSRTRNCHEQAPCGTTPFSCYVAEDTCSY